MRETTHSTLLLGLLSPKAHDKEHIPGDRLPYQASLNFSLHMTFALVLSQIRGQIDEPSKSLAGTLFPRASIRTTFQATDFVEENFNMFAVYGVERGPIDSF